MVDVEEKIISGVVVGWDFRTFTEDDSDIRLCLELQMFDGKMRSLSFGLDRIPELYSLFFHDNPYDSGGVLDFLHCRVQCLVRYEFRDTPLGVMRTSYSVKCVRGNVHQDWLSVY